MKKACRESVRESQNQRASEKLLEDISLELSSPTIEQADRNFEIPEVPEPIPDDALQQNSVEDGQRSGQLATMYDVLENDDLMEKSLDNLSISEILDHNVCLPIH